MHQKYVPDIARFGAVCEANYARIRRLWSREGAEVEARYQLSLADQRLGELSIERVDISRYTETLALHQISSVGRWLNDPGFTVRLYDDARAAEVISYNGMRTTRAIHDYPNRFMHQPDEKLQINEFLADWLEYCLRIAHVNYDVTAKM